MCLSHQYSSNHHIEQAAGKCNKKKTTTNQLCYAMENLILLNAMGLSGLSMNLAELTEVDQWLKI